MTRSVRFRDLFESLWLGKDPDTLTLDVLLGSNWPDRRLDRPHYEILAGLARR